MRFPLPTQTLSFVKNPGAYSTEFRETWLLLNSSGARGVTSC
jgi:hypothetical protein